MNKADSQKIDKWIQLTLTLEVLVISFVIIFFESARIDFKDTRRDVIAVSAVFSSILITYLTSKAITIRQEKTLLIEKVRSQTQKLHRFRRIVNKLLQSNIWPKGLAAFIDHKYNDVDFFRLNRQTFVGVTQDPRISTFITDSTFGDVKYLYLELRSFVAKDHFETSLYSEFDIQHAYKLRLIELWIEHYCGNGLYYYFDHKWPSAKGSLNLGGLTHQDEIELKSTAVQIDRERYELKNVDNKFIAALGTQVTSDILPKLYSAQSRLEAPLPRVFDYLIGIMIGLVTFGIILPLLTELLNLPTFFDVLAISVIMSTTCYFLLSFRSFLQKEVTI